VLGGYVGLRGGGIWLIVVMVASYMLSFGTHILHWIVFG
jgi:hypothetical protein